jgi:ABC-type nitrate/sulfonate/bicarbonate transport system substrate-binding protein
MGGKRNGSVVRAAAVLMTLLLTCAVPAAAVAQQGTDTLRVAYPPGFVIGVLDFLKALTPHLAEYGIKLDLIPFRGGADSAIAVAAGRADFNLGSVSPVVSVALQGSPLKIINAYAFEDANHRTGTVVVVRNEIKNWNDLRGKTLGTHRLGSLSDVTARLLLAKHGLTVGKDITIIELPFDGMAPALQRNQVQALAFFPPYAAEIYNQGYGSELGRTSEVIPQLVRESWTVNTFFLRRNRALTLRLMKAILLATYDLSRMPDARYISFIGSLWDGPQAILPDLSKYKMLHDLFVFDPAALRGAVETQVRVMQDFGIVKRVPAGFVDKLVDDSVMTQAYQELHAQKRLP